MLRRLLFVWAAALLSISGISPARAQDTVRDEPQWVILIDTSGSMQDELRRENGRPVRRCDAAVAAVTELMRHMPRGQRVSVVRFAQVPEVWVPWTMVTPESAPNIANRVGSLRFDGSTYFGEAIGYSLHLLDGARREGMPLFLVVYSDGISQNLDQGKVDALVARRNHLFGSLPKGSWNLRYVLLGNDSKDNELARDLLRRLDGEVIDPDPVQGAAALIPVSPELTVHDLAATVGSGLPTLRTSFRLDGSNPVSAQVRVVLPDPRGKGDMFVPVAGSRAVLRFEPSTAGCPVRMTAPADGVPYEGGEAWTDVSFDVPQGTAGGNFAGYLQVLAPGDSRVLASRKVSITFTIEEGETFSLSQPALDLDAVPEVAARPVEAEVSIVGKQGGAGRPTPRGALRVRLEGVPDWLDVGIEDAARGSVAFAGNGEAAIDTESPDGVRLRVRATAVPGRRAAPATMTLRLVSTNPAARVGATPATTLRVGPKQPLVVATSHAALAFAAKAGSVAGPLRAVTLVAPESAGTIPVAFTLPSKLDLQGGAPGSVTLPSPIRLFLDDAGTRPAGAEVAVSRTPVDVFVAVPLPSMTGTVDGVIDLSVPSGTVLDGVSRVSFTARITPQDVIATAGPGAKQENWEPGETRNDVASLRLESKQVEAKLDIATRGTDRFDVTVTAEGGTLEMGADGRAGKVTLKPGVPCTLRVSAKLREDATDALGTARQDALLHIEPAGTEVGIQGPKDVGVEYSVRRARATAGWRNAPGPSDDTTVSFDIGSVVATDAAARGTGIRTRVQVAPETAADWDVRVGFLGAALAAAPGAPRTATATQPPPVVPISAVLGEQSLRIVVKATLRPGKERWLATDRFVFPVVDLICDSTDRVELLGTPGRAITYVLPESKDDDGSGTTLLLAALGLVVVGALVWAFLAWKSAGRMRGRIAVADRADDDGYDLAGYGQPALTAKLSGPGALGFDKGAEGDPVFRLAVERRGAFTPSGVRLLPVEGVDLTANRERVEASGVVLADRTEFEVQGSRFVFLAPARKAGPAGGGSTGGDSGTGSAGSVGSYDGGSGGTGAPSGGSSPPSGGSGGSGGNDWIG